jgi:putative ABC transport system ATP-binding protein
VISVAGVRRTFEDGRVQALRGVSFDVAAGEFVALTGASGSGKSTLLNLVGGLDRADAGTIAVDGTIGFVFQSHNLLPTLTASENVQVAMFGKRPRREREARARELLAEVGLAERVDALPATLSGGERQRVAIARALANEPQVILADEPTGALDSETGKQVLGVLDALRATHGTTILMVTNDEEAAAQADRVLRLRDGLIHAEAPRPVSA